MIRQYFFRIFFIFYITSAIFYNLATLFLCILYIQNLKYRFIKLQNYLYKNIFARYNDVNADQQLQATLVHLQNGV